MKKGIIINEFDLPGEREASAGEAGHVGVTIPIFRRSLLLAMLAVAFAALMARGADLQIVRGADYRKTAEGNRVKTIPVPAPRGALLDRRGIVLAENKPTFSLAVIPAELPRERTARGAALQELARIARLPFEDIAGPVESAERSWQPLYLARNIDHDEAIRLILETKNLTGVAVVADASRVYPTAAGTESLGHLLGYTSRSSGAGAQGIEAAFDERLRGAPGARRVEVDSSGREIRTVTADDARPGERITLTIDAELQKVAERLLRRRGAVVVMDPRDGAVRALVSLPGFDPNIFSRPVDPATFAALDLFPRATAGGYPSGSIIKPFIAAAALESGIITPQTNFLSTGGIWYANRWFFPDWKAGGHGTTNLTKAIAESVNTYFYRVGEMMGPGALAAALTKFGFGDKPGLIPTPSWKKVARNEEWYIGDTYHMAIGQGDVLVSPLQMATALSALINGGTVHKPKFDERASPESVGSVSLKPETIAAVKTGMRATVTVGVAATLASLPIAVAGKTGTAEWQDGKRPHAWFEGYAPADDPQVVVIVLVEEGGEGSVAAVPIARELLRWMHLTGWFAP